MIWLETARVELLEGVNSPFPTFSAIDFQHLHRVGDVDLSNLILISPPIRPWNYSSNKTWIVPGQLVAALDDHVCMTSAERYSDLANMSRLLSPGSCHPPDMDRRDPGTRPSEVQWHLCILHCLARDSMSW